MSQEWLLREIRGQDHRLSDQHRRAQDRRRAKSFARVSASSPEYTFAGRCLGGQAAQPLIEVDGKMQFQLPGTPLFPSATDGLLLKPTLRWQIDSEILNPLHMRSWPTSPAASIGTQPTMSLLLTPPMSPATRRPTFSAGSRSTIRSGTEFPQARIKLMAGDVAKIQAQQGGLSARTAPMAMPKAVDSLQPGVTQKAFDDFPSLRSQPHRCACAMAKSSRCSSSMPPDVALRRSYIYDGLGGAVAADLRRQRESEPRLRPRQREQKSPDC